MLMKQIPCVSFRKGPNFGEIQSRLLSRTFLVALWLKAAAGYSKLLCARQGQLSESFRKLRLHRPTLFLLLASATLTAREIPLVSPARAGLSESKLAEVNQFMERSVAEQ